MACPMDSFLSQLIRSAPAGTLVKVVSDNAAAPPRSGRQYSIHRGRCPSFFNEVAADYPASRWESAPSSRNCSSLPQCKEFLAPPRRPGGDSSPKLPLRNRQAPPLCHHRIEGDRELCLLPRNELDKCLSGGFSGGWASLDDEMRNPSQSLTPVWC
jgi:hypothetical protein